jgi:hypothetical protein
MGSANPVQGGWNIVEVATSRTLTWDDHGKTIFTIAGDSDPVELTLPKVADFDKFWVRIVQWTKIPKLLTTATIGVYDKFLMPNMPGTTEKLEPASRGVALARLELLGRAGTGWVIVGGDGAWQDVDDTDIVYPLGGNLGGLPGDFVMFDDQGQLTDSGFSSRSVPLFFDFRGASKVTTGNATAGGGNTTGDIEVGIAAGAVIALKVTAAGVTVDSDIEFFADAARTNRIYFAEGKDCNTSPHVDGTAWACLSFSAELEDAKLYYKITNNGANDSTYDIELFGFGTQPTV